MVNGKLYKLYRTIIAHRSSLISVLTNICHIVPSIIINMFHHQNGPETWTSILGKRCGVCAAKELAFNPSSVVVRVCASVGVYLSIEQVFNEFWTIFELFDHVKAYFSCNFSCRKTFLMFDPICTVHTIHFWYIPIMHSCVAICAAVTILYGIHHIIVAVDDTHTDTHVRQKLD